MVLSDASQLILPGFTSPTVAAPLTRSADGVGTPKRIQSSDTFLLALVPKGDAAAQINRIAWNGFAEHELTGRPLGLARYHVSLHSLRNFPGDADSLVAWAEEMFAPIAAFTSSFELKMDRMLSLHTNTDRLPLVLRDSGHNGALLGFYRCLGEAIPKSKKAFTPHVTLLYDAKNIEEHAVERVSWEVNELVLVRSLVGQGRHEYLARWPLCG